MTKQRYMLMFSIGPVQSLIAQARKTRDLWLGSYLLAKLMEAAMQGIDRDKLVFPGNPTVEQSIADLPNKYIALFNSGEDAKKVAEQSIDDIKDQWKTILKDVKARVFPGTDHHTAQDIVKRDEIWDQQTNFESFFEVYWVAVPEPELKEEHARSGNAEKRYQFWLEKAQAVFDARKRLRNFQQQSESGEKSTISGEREALRGVGTSRQAIREYWRKVAVGQSIKDIYHDGSERLDAIDTVKRFALYAKVLQPKNPETEQLEKMDFPSTSSIATASFVKLLLEKLLNEEQDNTLVAVIQFWLASTGKELAKSQPSAIPYLYDKAKKNLTQLDILRRDGDCFFEETFADKTFQKNYLGTKIDGARAAYALTQLLQTVGTRPSPYYALIQMDGDHVGTILSNAENEQRHRDISFKLSNFARREVPGIVQNAHPGRVVYAGGDDLIAFSPLISLLNMVDALQDRYGKALGEKATASTGIAIAHHTTPLSLVRQAAFEAVHLAKERYGRNALVVTIMRRSGEQTRVGCHWKYEGLKAEEQPLTLFGEFYRLLISEQLSESSIHVLLDEAPALIELEANAQQSEIRRVLQRKQHGPNDLADERSNALPDEEARKLAERVVHLAEAMDKAMEKERADDENDTRTYELEKDALRVGLVEVFGWLLVMAFLAREEHHLDTDVRERVHVQ